MAYKKPRRQGEEPDAPRGNRYDNYGVEFSALVIDQIDAGTSPWRMLLRPGFADHGGGGMPYNRVSGKAYSGSNALRLAMEQERCGYSTNGWITVNQGMGLGGQIRKGERGTQLVKWIERDGKDEKVAPDKERDTSNLFPVIFYSFNSDQFDGLPQIKQREMPTEHERHEQCEKLLTDSGAVIRHDGGKQAFYRPGTDTIHLPLREAFLTLDALYATALHELGHWSGAKGRLDRDLTGRFGSIEYAREELVAEISSWMIGMRLGIGHDPGHHASYVEHWRQIIKDDPKAILKACTLAEKVCDFIGVAKYEHEPELVQDKERTKELEATNAQGKSAEWSPDRTKQRDREPELARGRSRDRDRDMTMSM